MKKSAKVVVFAHQKGGVGKTVMCNLFAHEFAKQGKAVCQIDTDKQGSVYLEYLAKKDTGERMQIPVFSLTTYNQVEEFVIANYTKYDFIFIDSTGNINSETIAILKNCDSIIIPITAGSTDWSSFQTFVKLLKDITAQDQVIIGILNKYKPHTNRWKEFLPVVKDFLNEYGIILPKMESSTCDELIPAQLREREDYTSAIISPLSDEKINRITKYEIIHLIDSIHKYIR